MQDEIKEQRAVKALLPRTYPAFFARFGRLTEVQIEAIPRILRGENLVVISPAASGKTEAVVAPVVERLLGMGKRGFAVLYVSPTRALVNDLYRRLLEPLEYLGLKLERKTGDHPQIDERRLPFMLLTTPESFDSLLCRHPRIFKTLTAVIVDEIHLLDNTPRGDQLRVLLERLRLIKPDFNGYALSATVDDVLMGERYFSGAGVVQVAKRREINAELLPGKKDWYRRVVRRLQEQGCDKALVFFNARSLAESGVKLFDLPPFSGRVWVHHASLNRQVREEVEARMTGERSGILCCTSTLELGIDIGDVDAVVLFRPPFNVSSLLQRIGRGNRRRGNGLYMIGVYLDPWERLLFETFIDCAREGKLFDKRYTPCLSVLPQQIISYCFQRRRIGTTLEAVRRIFQPLVGNSPVVEKVFFHLVREGILQEKGNGVYFLTPKVEHRVETGKVHSNIQEKSFGQYQVVDVSSGQEVGSVFFVFERFVLGGKSWEVVERREKDKKIFVRPHGAVSPSTKVFEGTGTGGYFYRMAEVLKSRIFPGLKSGEFPYFFEGGQAYLVHLLGATYGGVLTLALQSEGVAAVDMAGKVMVLPAARLQEGRFPLPGRDAVKRVVRDHLLEFEDSLGSGAFFRDLPPDLQIEDHLLTLDIDGLYEFLDSIQLVRMEPAVVKAQITEHLPGENGETGERG
ncbi:DEAD/DEAH box helicase [candidate division WOR-3 bacterium]|nr:DEAD/DEAH box helicase [candidate division WOR-3 bacterium]